MADFFEGVKRGLEKGIAVVGARSKEMLEGAQLRAQIRGLEEEKQAKLEELGNIVHTMIRRGALDQERIQEKSRAITVLESAIREREEQLKALQVKAQESLGRVSSHAIGRCDCGADLFEGAKFCGRCGKPVSEATTTVAVAAGARSFQCSHCGSPVVADARFCGACGSSLSARNRATSETGV